MSMFDMMLNTLLKSINVEEIMKRDDVQAAFQQVREIAADFRLIREKIENIEIAQAEIMRRLDEKDREEENDAVDKSAQLAN